MHACSTVSIRDAMAETARQVDAALEQFTRFPPGCPPRLAEAIRYSLLAPGKRLRPAWCYGRPRPAVVTDGRALPAACAVEMIHSYSLIHDDLPAMDDDDLRRGRPTLPRAFDEATAILAGDALLTLAFEVLAQRHPAAEVAAACCAALAAAAGPTGWSAARPTISAAKSTDGDVRSARSDPSRARPGPCFACRCGWAGWSAGADADQRAALDAYGRKLGLAFQIVDDLLDVRGDEAALGKRVGKDAAPRQAHVSRRCWASRKACARRAALIDEACAALIAVGFASAAELEALARYVAGKESLMDKLLAEDRIAARPAEALGRRARTARRRDARGAVQSGRRTARRTSPRTWAWSSCAWRCTPRSTSAATA